MLTRLLLLLGSAQAYPSRELTSLLDAAAATSKCYLHRPLVAYEGAPAFNFLATKDPQACMDKCSETPTCRSFSLITDVGCFGKTAGIGHTRGFWHLSQRLWRENRQLADARNSDEGAFPGSRCCSGSASTGTRRVPSAAILPGIS